VVRTRWGRVTGTFLYVGIHDDVLVNNYMGANYPIMNLHERVLNVLSCKFVDEVVIGAPWQVTRDIMTSLNIRIVVVASVVTSAATKSSSSSSSTSSSSSSSSSHASSYADFDQLTTTTTGGIEVSTDAPDPYEYPRKSGQIQLVSVSRTVSSQDVVRRIIQNRLKYEKRNKARSKKELAYLSERQFVQEV